MNKLIKNSCILALLVVSFQSFALRCNGKIIMSGDSEFKVRNQCGSPEYVYTNRSTTGDYRKNVFYRKNGATYNIEIRNGVVHNITMERN